MSSRNVATSPMPRSLSCRREKRRVRTPAILSSGERFTIKERRMTNDEARNNDEIRMTKKAAGVFRHSSFVIFSALPSPPAVRLEFLSETARASGKHHQI